MDALYQLAVGLSAIALVGYIIGQHQGRIEKTRD